MSTTYQSIVNSSDYKNAKKEFISLLNTKLSELKTVRPARQELTSDYQKVVKHVGALRGRDLYYPFVGSGAGNGPFVELQDGSVKFDLITGIGVNFYGHGNISLLEAQFDGLWCDIMQGNLGPNPEYGNLMEALLSCVGSRSKLKHVWLTTCGATANENALKMIRQKMAPATKIMAFKGCFAGRTTALQEITDNPKYREGQPTYNEVFYLDFYNPALQNVSPAAQAEKVIQVLREEVERQPNTYACLEFEIVQGEGGFNVAPEEFIVPIVPEAKKLGLAIWVDEIQTFGRTGEVFCYQRVGLEEYVDIVTVAKLLQTGAVVYTSELNPKPGLISGTFAGSSGGLRAGTYIINDLKSRLCGKNGRIYELENQTKKKFEAIKSGPLKDRLQDYTVFGGMVAYTVFDGSLESTKKYLTKLWDLGAIAFFCGRGPYRVRMLPPWGVVSNEQWAEALTLMEKALAETTI